MDIDIHIDDIDVDIDSALYHRVCCLGCFKRDLKVTSGTVQIV